MSGLNAKKALFLAITHAFVANKNAESLFVTEDGNCFTPANKGHGAWHAKSTKQELAEIPRIDFAEAIKELEAELEAAKNAKSEQDKETELKGLADKIANDEKAAADKIAADLKAEEDAKAAELEAAKAALIERAKAVNLPGEATEEEIVAAELAAKSEKGEEAPKGGKKK